MKKVEKKPHKLWKNTYSSVKKKNDLHMKVLKLGEDLLSRENVVKAAFLQILSLEEEKIKLNDENEILSAAKLESIGLRTSRSKAFR